jgi:hypothetical protein
MRLGNRILPNRLPPTPSWNLFDCAFRTLTCPHRHNIFGTTFLAQHFCRSAFAPLRANADSTLTVTRASAIKTLIPASEVVSAFARRGAKADLRGTDRIPWWSVKQALTEVDLFGPWNYLWNSVSSAPSSATKTARSEAGSVVLAFSLMLWILPGGSKKDSPAL